MASDKPIGGRCARVTRAMELEVMRQLKAGGLISATGIDFDGRMVIHGTLDLAALAEVTETAMRRAGFGI